MRLFSTLSLCAVMLGGLVPADAEAASRSCRNAAMIDARGASAFDGTIPDTSPDGLTTIAEVAVNTADLSELTDAVLAADSAVLTTLADPHADLTVFAPTNEAFWAIPEDVYNGIGSEGLLTSVLLYHVVPGYFDPRRVFYLRAVDTALGQDLYVRSSRPENFVNQSRIECTGVKTDNGLVWIINSVLIPQFFYED